jgi:hypothetical protein
MSLLTSKITGSLTKKPVDVMQIFLDESGAIRDNGPFLAGLWFTWKSDLWRAKVEEVRRMYGFFYEWHFHKITGIDLRYMSMGSLLHQLDEYNKTWYYRGIYVSDTSYKAWRKEHYTTQGIYDFIVETVATRFLHSFPEKSANLIIDKKNRPKNDLYLPQGLEEHLNELHENKDWPLISISMADSKEEPLLQVVDCITAAIRQWYFPAKNNEQKTMLALLAKRLKNRISIWEYK